MDILVIGAGVSGLSCAVRLLEEGRSVEVWARAFSPDIVSAVAAAVWYPPRAGRDERCDRWLATSLQRFRSISSDPRSGVMLRGGIEFLRAPRSDEGWRDLLPGFRHARADELRAGFIDGFVAEDVPVIEMPVYLQWLRARVLALGGTIRRRSIAALDDACAHAGLVVNCAGLGARELVPDPTMTPIRGQVVRVAQFGLERYVLDEENPDGIVYIYPRAHDVVCGGTREPGNELLQSDDAVARAILERCAVLEPRVLEAKIVSHGVGLRPGRPAVRLEAEARAGALVVHDYGHAGNGVTLSWGCADDVARLLAGVDRKGIPFR